MNRISNAVVRSNQRQTFDAPEMVAQVHALDTEESREKHARLMGYVQFERDYQAENRMFMARDEAYYDHNQLTSDEIALLEARGQGAVQHNIVKPIIDWLIGTERRMRFDHNVLPRGKEDSEAAESKTKLLKYLSDTNRSPFERSSAFSDTVKAGIGWTEVSIRSDMDDGERLLTRNVSWRHIYHDSMSRRNDMEDARYVVRIRFVDLDIAVAYFPERRAQLEASANRVGDRRYQTDEDDVWYMGERLNDKALRGGYRSALATESLITRDRKQVKLIEIWYREVQDCECMAAGPWKGAPLQESDGPLKYMANEKGWQSRTQKKLRVRLAIMTETDFLIDVESPYRHNRLPLIPTWCYRDASTGLPYGGIRGLIGQQDSFNKLMSKALYAISSKRTFYEDGAFEEEDEDNLPTEIARPDAIVHLKMGGLNKIRVETDHGVATAALNLANITESLTHNISGVTPDNLGRTSSLQSGKAILAKQDQGSMVTAEVFDNLLLSSQQVGELELANIEQFYTEPKVIRVLGEADAAKFTTINGETDENGEPVDPITASKADFVISERDARATMRQAQFESFKEVLTSLAPHAPDVVRNLLDVLVDMSDMPLRETAVKRIRQITGQRDENEKLTPEEQQAAQAQAEAAKKKDDLQNGMMEASLRKLHAEADNLDARALKERLHSIFASLESGSVVLSAPQVGQVAAEIMANADAPGGAPPMQIPESPEQPITDGYVQTDRLNPPTR